MKKEMRIILPVIILLAGIFTILIKDYNESNKKVCFPSLCIKAEIADSTHERAKGLMYRSNLEENKGMLFIFDSSDKHKFWMKNTLIPLDIIWIDENLRVVHIATTQPCTKDPCQNYSPRENSLYVIEVNAGFAEKNSIKVGDNVRI